MTWPRHRTPPQQPPLPSCGGFLGGGVAQSGWGRWSTAARCTWGSRSRSALVEYEANPTVAGQHQAAGPQAIGVAYVAVYSAFGVRRFPHSATFAVVACERVVPESMLWEDPVVTAHQQKVAVGKSGRVEGAPIQPGSRIQARIAFGVYPCVLRITVRASGSNREISNAKGSSRIYPACTHGLGKHPYPDIAGFNS